jgi:hypothetical protein
MKKVNHDITLFAYSRDERGIISIFDIVETSFKNASYFARRWTKCQEIYAISAALPSNIKGLKTTGTTRVITR